MIYFDNNATTAVAPPVLDAMREALEELYGNPSSAYYLGQRSASRIAAARQSVADIIGADPSEIVFTSGGTESDNWAILGALEMQPGQDHIITTRVEHEAVRRTIERLEKRGFRVTWLNVDESGALDIDALAAALSKTTALVSVMLANNETGIVFPVGEIAQLVKERSNALIHVDGVNAVGKISIDLKSLQVDLFSLSGHKFHGPKGVGALYIRTGVELPPMYAGGGQESGRRAGTEAVHQIAGLGAAAKLASDVSPMGKVGEMRDKLEAAILTAIPNAFLNGTSDPRKRLPNTSYISFENTNGEMILARLNDAGICVSTGSACNSQDHTASAVLQAMNVPYTRAMGSIRFSLGRFNTMAEADRVIAILPDVINDLRKIGGNYEAFNC
jgi:cysteine desulfurase